MSLMSVMYKDICVLVGMVFEHWIHKKFVEIKIDIFGKTRVRVAQLRSLKHRERFLIEGIRDSIHTMREYRALVKAGYHPQ